MSCAASQQISAATRRDRVRWFDARNPVLAGHRRVVVGEHRLPALSGLSARVHAFPASELVSRSNTARTCVQGFLGFRDAHTSLTCCDAAARVQNGLPAAERGAVDFEWSPTSDLRTATRAPCASSSRTGSCSRCFIAQVCSRGRREVASHSTDLRSEGTHADRCCPAYRRHLPDRYQLRRVYDRPGA